MFSSLAMLRNRICSTEHENRTSQARFCIGVRCGRPKVLHRSVASGIHSATLLTASPVRTGTTDGHIAIEFSCDAGHLIASYAVRGCKRVLNINHDTENGVENTRARGWIDALADTAFELTVATQVSNFGSLALKARPLWTEAGLSQQKMPSQ